jgi:ubiquinone/menaquinone biosynthesis C-methylase UbiE
MIFDGVSASAGERLRPMISAFRSLPLDVAIGTGEAAVMALLSVGSSGTLVGTDIAPEMLGAALVRLNAEHRDADWERQRIEQPRGT